MRREELEPRLAPGRLGSSHLGPVIRLLRDLRGSLGSITFRSLAPVAQLDRASDYGSEGWGFEFLRAREVTH